MEYLKLFENKTLDNILDKITSSGENSLSAWEKRFLANHGTPEGDKMERELIDNPPKNVDKFEILWGELDEYDMRNFINNHKIMPEFATKSWGTLPDTVKSEFRNFVKYNGIL